MPGEFKRETGKVLSLHSERITLLLDCCYYEEAKITLLEGVTHFWIR